MNLFAWINQQQQAMILDPVPKSIQDTGFEAHRLYEVHCNTDPEEEYLDLLDSFDSGMTVEASSLKKASIDLASGTIQVPVEDGVLTLAFYSVQRSHPLKYPEGTQSTNDPSPMDEALSLIKRLMECLKRTVDDTEDPEIGNLAYSDIWEAESFLTAHGIDPES